MCSFCGWYPCDAMCPYADEEVPVTYCEGCGHALYGGDDYYPNFAACQYCINNFKETVLPDD